MNQLFRWVGLLLLVVSFLPTAAVQAANCSWVSGVSGTWSDPNNWSCNQIPGPTDHVVIEGGSNLTLDQSVNISSLTITGSSTLSGPHPLVVSGPTQITSNNLVTISTNGSALASLEATLGNGATLQFIDPAFNPNSLASLTLTQPPNSSGGLFLQLAPLAIGNLALQGNLRFSHNLTITQSINWAGGDLTSLNQSQVVDPNAAQLRVAAGATLTISGADRSLNTTLVNDGSASWSGTTRLLAFNGSRLLNRGSLLLTPSVTTPGSIQLNAQLDNQGTLIKQGREAFRSNANLNNSGVIQLEAGTLAVGDFYRQSAGSTKLVGGLLLLGSGSGIAQISGGQLSGSGIISGNLLLDAGRFSPTSVVTITGDISQAPASTTAITITGLQPRRDFGQVQILGSAVIDGQLEVNRSADFRPASGDQFVIMVCGQCRPGFNQPVFRSATGSMAPAFGQLIDRTNNRVLVAEPSAGLQLASQAQQILMRQGDNNRYQLNIINPTDQAIQLNYLTITMPISLTYQSGSTQGIISSDPQESTLTNKGLRELSWSTNLQLQPGNNLLSLGVNLSLPTSPKQYTIDIVLETDGPVIRFLKVAPVVVPLDATRQVTVSGAGTLNRQTTPPTLLAAKLLGGFSNGITITTEIICPYNSCGTLLNVYLKHGANIYLMQRSGNPIRSQRSALQSDGFWDGYISGPSVFPGEPTEIFPDWEDHRACIAFDYGGGGGRPTGCVDGGDRGPNPQLYDPSGIIRDATTGQPITGASVTLHRIPNTLPDSRNQTRDCRTLDTRGGSFWQGTAPATGIVEDPSISPRQIDPQINPQVTGSDGRYGWNVVTGCWYVTVSAAGYQNKTSALVGVPPEVTDLDIQLTPLSAPQVLIFVPLIGR